MALPTLSLSEWLGDKGSINKTTLHSYYASPNVRIEEEYMLLGPLTMISATGGSLGLFLGFSCYGAIWNIFEMVETIFHSIFMFGGKKRGQHVVTSENVVNSCISCYVNKIVQNV